MRVLGFITATVIVGAVGVCVGFWAFARWVFGG